MQTEIGKSWLLTIPILEFDDNGDINVKLQK